MLTLSNSLSFIRAPLALLFLTENTFLRILAVLLAMLTDSVDGYFARRSKSVSRFGTILDPTMDKFFVYFVLSILVLQNSIPLWAAFAMVSRDFFLLIYGIYLKCTGKWQSYEFRAIRWGKLTTALQFIVIAGISLHFVFPWYIYTTFIVFGALAFRELFQNQPSS